MSESAMQTLYAVLATAALAVGVRTIVANHFSQWDWANQKPFTCTYCLCGWVAPLVTGMMLHNTGMLSFLFSVIVVHFAAYCVTQRFT